MDPNEITMEMDVKMDLKEKKSEYFQLRVSTATLYFKNSKERPWNYK